MMGKGEPGRIVCTCDGSPAMLNVIRSGLELLSLVSLLTWPMASRSEPAPPSVVKTTTKLVSKRRSSSASRLSRHCSWRRLQGLYGCRRRTKDKQLLSGPSQCAWDIEDSLNGLFRQECLCSARVQ